MTKTVIGMFSSENRAKEAVDELRKRGFDREISLLAKDNRGRRAGAGGDQENEGFGALNMEQDTETITEGVTTGGVLGGIAGLAMGAGALAIPGIGPLIAAGPIMGLLSGALTGGIAGGLIDWGIPEAEGKRFEEDVKRGKILVSVRSTAPKLDEAADILRSYGADEVHIY